MGKNSWKKRRPHSSEEVERLLNIERKLTADWYQRMTDDSWRAGEKIERLRKFSDLEISIDRILQEMAAKAFASLETD